MRGEAQLSGANKQRILHGLMITSGPHDATRTVSPQPGNSRTQAQLTWQSAQFLHTCCCAAVYVLR